MESVEIFLLDCGQGNCALVKSGSRSALIDARVETESGEVDLIPVIKSLLDGISLDYLIISHPHKDHIEGIKQLLEEIEVGCLVDSGLRIDTGNDDNDYSHYETYLREIDKRCEEDGTFLLGVCGVSIEIGDAKLTFLTPEEDFRNENFDSTTINRKSIVVRVETTNNTSSRAILILADTVRATFEEDLEEDKWELLPSDVVIAAHHGSKGFFYLPDDSDAEKDPYKDHLGKMSPSYIFVSCNPDEGSENDPPHKQALKLLEEQGSVHRSDKHGSVRVTLREVSDNIEIDFDSDWEPASQSDTASSGQVANPSVPVFTPRPKG